MASNSAGKKHKEDINLRQKFFRLNTLIAFILAAGIIYIFFTRFDFGEVYTILKEANLLYIIGAAAVFYGFLPLRGHRWKILLDESGTSLPGWDLVRFYLMAFFVNSIMPARIGDVYRAYILKKNKDVSFSLSLGVIFSERIFDLAVTALLVVTSGYAFLASSVSNRVIDGLKIGLAVIAVAVILFVFLAWKSEWLMKLLPSKIKQYSASFSQGIFRSPARIPVVSAESFLIWLSEAGRLFLVAAAVGFPLSFPMAIFISQASLILMSLPITPAGLGLVELLMITIMVPGGYAAETAGAIIIADRLISYWSVIIFGGIHFYLSPRYR